MLKSKNRSEIRSISDTVEGQAVRAQSLVSDQALKASDSVRDQSNSVQSSSLRPKSESKTSRSVQFKTSVPVSSNSPNSSQCTLAVGRSSIQIENSLREKINSLLRKEILYRDIFEEIESTGKNEIIRGQEKYRIQKNLLMIHITGQPEDVQYWRVVVPDDLEVKSLLVSELHSIPYAAHPGVQTDDQKSQTLFLVEGHDR